MMAERAAGNAAMGIAGLDDILNGGLAAGQVFLLEGSPGTGKTTIALSFLLAGERSGEPGLYVTLSETEDELRVAAASHGWQIGAGVTIHELLPPESLLNEDQEQTLLYSSDLELGETTRAIFDKIEQVKPRRVVIDSLSEIRLLAQSSLRYRRQMLALKHYFARTGATVLLLDDLTTDTVDKTVHSVVHGVVHLEQLAPQYGAERRRVRITKYRGRPYRGGYHDMKIRTGAVEVYPRLVALEHRTDFERATTSSGIAGLDALLGGGIDRGSSALVLGPAGAGKTLVAIQFIMAAVARGERAAMFLFDEEIDLLFKRMQGMGIDLEAAVRRGGLHVEQLDAAELSPGEFAHRVRTRMTEAQAKTVLIDSLNGYQAAMPEENALILHMHELLQYLNRQGASTFLTVAQHGLFGDMKAPVDITYLADTVILLRYFEAMGKVRRAVSVIKKRTGRHEDTIREYQIGASGLSVGEPLEQFHGVLRGVPMLAGGHPEGLMHKPGEGSCRSP
jgi:circadian clock protein KaiC